MAVLKKAVLINYDRLSQMVESNTVDEETVYFLSGKDIIRAIEDIQNSFIGINEKLKNYVQSDKLVSADTTKAPDFIGQIAVVGSSIYIAESTEGPGSWRILQLQPNDHL